LRRGRYARKPSATVLDNNENVEQSEGHSDRNEEVTRHNRFRMVLQKR
jgi:hypothetical protein